MIRPPPSSPLFPHTPPFRSELEDRPSGAAADVREHRPRLEPGLQMRDGREPLLEQVVLEPGVRESLHPLPDRAVVRICRDRKSTRLNSSHANISYAVFCLKK